MAITKTIVANGSKGHHKFSLRVNEDRTSDNSSFMSFSFTLAPIQTGWDWADWGEKISYVIKIGDNTYNGTIPAYNGSSTITLKSESNIEIPHESDGTKTINISFSVTDTTGANYTCGNASSNSTLTLSELHRPPEISVITMTENNAKLTSLNVSNNTIVQYLSNKKIVITAVYDDATISNCSVYHNNTLIGTSTTNEVNINFGNVGELIDNSIGYVSLMIAITDSKGGYSTQIFDFPIIKYTRPSLEGASTNIRRKTGGGTVLTDNKALLNFVGTCYKGNDVIGNNNKPKVEYKIWNGTEPSYISLTTPNVANVTIKNYELSNLLYTSAYNYKIKITDTFTTTETTINLKADKLSTGVSVWSEYKDRVDFEKITVKNLLIEDFVIERGENYTKWASGKLEQWKEVSMNPLYINEPNGNVYVSDLSLGDWDVPFSKTPTKFVYSIGPMITQRNVWIGGATYKSDVNGSPSATSAGIVQVYSSWSAEIYGNVNIYAVGQWK